MLIQHFHIRPTGTPFFHEVARILERQVVMHMQIGDSERGRAITAGVAMDEDGVSLLSQSMERLHSSWECLRQTTTVKVRNRGVVKGDLVPLVFLLECG